MLPLTLSPSQEKHLEMYREEVKAEEQTIDQFLLSKHFPTRDDIMITLDNLKTNNSLTLNTGACFKFPLLVLIKMMCLKNLFQVL